MVRKPHLQPVRVVAVEVVPVEPLVAHARPLGKVARRMRDGPEEVGKEDWWDQVWWKGDHDKGETTLTPMPEISQKPKTTHMESTKSCVFFFHAHPLYQFE